MEVHLKITGCLFVALALLHVIFPRYFNWKEEFCTVSLVNRQMMYIHTFFLALVLLLMGLLCITSAPDIIRTVLGRRLALGLGLFWACRLVIQFFGYSSTLWRGKRKETAVHIIFSIIWTYVSFVFFYVYYTGDNILI